MEQIPKILKATITKRKTTRIHMDRICRILRVTTITGRMKMSLDRDWTKTNNTTPTSKGVEMEQMELKIITEITTQNRTSRITPKINSIRMPTIKSKAPILRRSMMEQ